MNLVPILNPYLIAFFHADASTAFNEQRVYIQASNIASPKMVFGFEVFPFLLDSPPPLNSASSTMVFAVSLEHALTMVKQLTVELVDVDTGSSFLFPLAYKVNVEKRQITLSLYPWVNTVSTLQRRPNNTQRIIVRLYKLCHALPAIISCRICWTRPGLVPKTRHRRKHISNHELFLLEQLVRQQRNRVLKEHARDWKIFGAFCLADEES